MYTRRISGTPAIEHGALTGAPLHKYADPTEGARGLSLEEARAVAREDASLVWVEVTDRPWKLTDGRGRVLGRFLAPSAEEAILVWLRDGCFDARVDEAGEIVTNRVGGAADLTATEVDDLDDECDDTDDVRA